MRVGLSTWNWLKPLGEEARLAPALREAIAAGFGVELWLDWTPEPELVARGGWPDLREASRNRVGLSLHSRLIHRFDLPTIREEIDLAAFLGADPLVVHPRSLGLEAGTLDARMEGGLGDAELAVIVEILSYARGRSVRLALENGSMDLLEAVTSAFPTGGIGSQLGICVDTGHANLHRQLYTDPAVEFIRKFRDRLIHLHVADNDGTADSHRVPGDGTVDWPAVFAELDRAAYRGALVLELAEPGAIGAAGRAAAFLESVRPPSGG